MTFDEIVKKMQSLDLMQFLQKADKGGFICPHCGSGQNGKHNTGGVKYYQSTGTASCHACGHKVDVIDLYQQQRGLSSFTDAVKAYAAENGITIDQANNGVPAKAKEEKPQQPAAIPMPVEERKELKAMDFTAYYEECSRRLQTSTAAQSYLARRGISLKTAIAAGIGFDPAADPAGSPGADEGAYKAHPVPRIIIPTAAGHYVGRSIDTETPGSYAKMNNKGGKPCLFNKRALWESDTVFVVQGAFDALSLQEVGAAAIALNSTSNCKMLIDELKENPTKATLLLALDNDKQGRKAQHELQSGLNQLNISNAAANIAGGYKDANEYLVADKAAFTMTVEKILAAQGLRPDNTANYLQHLMAGEIEQFKESGKRKTGYENLDAKAGALYPGLYVLAAISSLGKTTFALQLADQLAAAGDDVIFFSMEQSRFELVSKSIARYTAQANMKTAVKSLAIRQGELPDNVLQAVDTYKAAISNRLSIVQGNFNCTIGYIGQYIRNYINKTGKRPVIFIDYLQILQPSQETRNSKKDEIDLAVTELKRISRDYNIPVIVISSLNRANYQLQFSFESLKESGGIEYTADVIWGLQLQCLDEPLFKEDKKISEKRQRIEAAKEEYPRKIKLICCKNRYGVSRYGCKFEYYSRHDLFIPVKTKDDK